MLEFLETLGNLKKTKRTGWLNNAISEAESIADHMHRMGILAMSIEEKDPKVDRTKLIKMAIVHDIAEALAGDITPYQGVSKEDKFKLEYNAIQTFKTQLNNSKFSLEIESLWLEYEDGKTLEALVCKDLDKYEMVVQAFEYEKDGHGPLDSFFESTEGKFTHPEIIALCDELYNARKLFHNKKTS